MKIRYNVNTCDHPKDSSELFVHLTKICPNNCAFCIDKTNIGVDETKPDIDAIIETIDKYKDRVKAITISGGEPFIFIDEFETLINWIKEHTNLFVYTVTSVPNICYNKKEQFFRILDKCDSIQISLQHYSNVTSDRIRASKSSFDRHEFYKELTARYGDKILGSLNIIKPYFKTKYDIVSNVCQFNQLGFKNIKICELFDYDSLYVDIPEMLGIKMNPPFAWGCKTEYTDTYDWVHNGKPFDGHLYIKRSCFMRSNLCQATIWDFIKMCTRWIFFKKYFYGVIHENGEIAPYWL